MAGLDACALEQRAQDFFAFEELPGDFAGAAGVPGIVGVYLFHGTGDFAQRLEGEEAGVLSKDFREAGFLSDDGPAGGEVATAAIAEPAGIEADVLILGHREFAFRAPDVIPVEPIVRAQVRRRTEAPAVAFEFFARSRVLDVGRELERLPGSLRRGDKADELTRFAPKIFFAPPLDIFQAARGPVRNGGENGGRPGAAIAFPKIGHDRLARGVPLQIMGRHRESIAADIFSEGEKRVMAPQIFDRRLHALIDLDLLHSRIAFDIQDAIAREQVVIEFLGAANVKDGVSLAVECANSLERKTSGRVPGEITRTLPRG